MPQLAALVRAKFPGAYDDLPDDELERQVLAKHPEYADLAKPEYVPVQRPQTVMGAGQRVMTEEPEKPATGFLRFIQQGAPLLERAAHPETWGDIASLVIPSGAPTRAIRGMLTSTVNTVKEAVPGNKLGFLGRVIAGQLRKASAEGPLIQATQPPIDRYAPNVSAYGKAQNLESLAPPVPYATPTTAPPPKLAISNVDFRRLQDWKQQGVSEEMALKLLQDLKERGNEAFNRR